MIIAFFFARSFLLVRGGAFFLTERVSVSLSHSLICYRWWWLADENWQ